MELTPDNGIESLHRGSWITIFATDYFCEGQVTDPGRMTPIFMNLRCPVAAIFFAAVPIRVDQLALIARTSAARASTGITGNSPLVVTGSLRR